MALSSQKWFSSATFNWVPLKLFTIFQWLRSTLLRKNKKIWASIQKVQVPCLKHLNKWKFSMCPNYALKLLQNKSKQTNQIFIKKLNNDASRVNTLGYLETLYTFFSAQHLSVPFFPRNVIEEIFQTFYVVLFENFFFFIFSIFCKIYLMFFRNKFGHFFSWMVQRDKKNFKLLKTGNWKNPIILFQVFLKRHFPTK